MNLQPLQIEHGDRFGKLTVLKRLPKKDRGPKYLCGCVCGHQLSVRRSHLVSGRRTACDHCTEQERG